MEESEIKKNLRRGGEYFVFSIWVQSQMTDLIIFHDHPRIINRFIEREERIPRTLRDKRMTYWQKNFRYVKDEFLARFGNSVSSQCKKDIGIIMGIRNAIGHSYVSLARDHFLYRPSSKKKLNEFKKAFDIIVPNSNPSMPRVYKFDFADNEVCKKNFEAIKRMDEVHLKSIATKLGVPHSRIR